MTTPRLLSERYELGEVLGFGGMAEVHRGRDTLLGRDVAVKVLRADLARDPQFTTRFGQEARNSAALNHPAIVSVYDRGEVAGETGPLPYIVMEYVDGQTLRDIVKTSGPMSQQRVIEVMADVCAALDFSHRHQIIHRDVKPANIMINRAGAVKVMDFGIARALGQGQNVTQTAAVIGTAQYLSPEQARGEPVDARSDVYAAGCVLFELLTGQPPFTGDTPVAVAYQHVREDPKHPSSVNPEIPPELDAVVLKALNKNPDNRYQSAAEMRTDLVRVRSGQVPIAPAVMSEDERTAMLAASPSTGPTRRINGGRHTIPPGSDYDPYYSDPYYSDPYYDDEEPRRRTARIVGIVAAVLVALGLVGFVAYQVVFSGPPPISQVAIPPLVDLPAQAAKNQLLALDLKIDERAVDSDVTKKGLVISARPTPGTMVNVRSTVVLEIGNGPANAAVPPLVGRTVGEATQLLQERGLILGEQRPRETPDPSQVGKVLESTPAAGENAPGGSPVAVVVGAPQTTVPVPDISGQDAETAEQTLRAAGFQVQREFVDVGGDEGSVAGTNPAAGTRVAAGSLVTLEISSGNGEQVREVPRVIGEDVDEARRILRDAGFNRVKVDETNAVEQLNGKVIRQSPSPGARAKPDDEITLVVGKSGG